MGKWVIKWIKKKKKQKTLEQIYFLLVKYPFVLQHCAMEINK